MRFVSTLTFLARFFRSASSCRCLSLIPRVAIFDLMNEVTHILDAIEEGHPQAAAQLLPLVYDELRKLPKDEQNPLANQPSVEPCRPMSGQSPRFAIAE
jgi:ECF sigma factor